MKNCFKALAFAILCTFGVHTSFAQCTASLFAGGAGTDASPYQISTAEQLQNVDKCLSAHFVLNNNIDLSSYLSGAGNNNGTGWQSIGSSNYIRFTGSFNGNGNKVSGLWINRSSDYVGLFGYASDGAVIKNIGVEINSDKGIKGNKYFGGLVGYNKGTISNSYVTGNIIMISTVNSYYVGSLVGNNDGTISNSYATGNVTSAGFVGGLVGVNSGTISNSYATGSVSGNSGVGGLVGYNSGTISNSYATGNVAGTAGYVGGLVGYKISGYYLNSYYDKETSGQTDTDKGIGKTTAEMKIQGTYEGWDFESIWEINPAKNNGYPTLFWQNTGHIASAIATTIPNYTWTGEPITPKPSINFNGTTLREGIDFQYDYANNIQVGTAVLRIVGKGAYQGQQANVAEFIIIAASCGTGFAGGAGTEGNPYKIANAKNLDAISNCLGDTHSGKYYELLSDVYLSDYLANSKAGWQPIGYNFSSSVGCDNRFQGILNGKGYKVSGLWINRPFTNYMGLFGCVYSNAEIRNIGVEIDDSKGGVIGKEYVGGLVALSVGTVISSYAIGNVIGSSESNFGYIGGLVGRNEGSISNSYATGNVSGGSYVGGLVGYNMGTNATISNSYATGNVSGNSAVGGLVGANGSGLYSGTISNSYATGSVSGNSGVGGLVGQNASSIISNSYAIGSVTGSSNVGGLVGYHSGGTISNSYYDKETSGQTDTGKGVGKTTAEMKTQSTYSGWDFGNTWFIASNYGILNNGYPILQWQLPNNIAIVSHIPPKEYIGTEIKPSFTVTLNKTTLTAGSHYNYTYSNNINAGTAIITITGTGTYSYLGSIYASFTITKKPLTITGTTAVNREYDGTTTVALAGGTLVGVVNGTAVNFAGTGTVAASGIGNNKAVTTNIILTGADAGNYTLTQPTDVTVNITPKAVTITGISIADKVYDGTTTATINGTAEVSGKVGNDIVTVTKGTASFANKNAGIGKTVTFANYTIGGANVGNYTLAAQPSGTANITAKPVTITGIAASDKEYDGTTTTTITGTATINGKIGSDVVTVINGSASFNDKNIGIGKTVTFSDFSLNGTDANNYTITTQPASVTANITAKPVTITASASNKVYDGTTTATITGTAVVNGKVGSDVVNVSNGTASFDNKNVGNSKPVAFSGFSLNGTDAGNYTLSAQPASVTANITPKPITITVSSITATSREYDGTTTAEVHGNASISGEVSGDNLTIVKGNASFNDKNVGTNKPVTFSGFSLSGADVSNYTVSVIEPISITANITAKPVTITGITASSKEYDGNAIATVTGTAEISGKIGSDDVNVIYGSASFNNKNAGNGKSVTFANFKLSGTDASNYKLSAQPANITANITAKSVTITGISARNKAYDGNTTATITGTAAVLGTISGDNVGVTNGTALFTDINVGIGKTVTFTNFILNGTDANNYTLSAQPSSVTANITAKPVTITGITALDKGYDGTTTAIITGTAEISGKIGDDEVTVISGTASFVNKNVGTGKTVVFNGYRLTGADADNYVLSAQPSGTANITAKPITITGITATNRVYNGTTTVALSGGTLVGIVSGDAVDFVLGSGTVATSNVGNGKAVTTNITLTGTDASNYTLTQPTNITVSITSPETGISSSSGNGSSSSSGTSSSSSSGNGSSSSSGTNVSSSSSGNSSNTETPTFPNRENPIIGRIGVQTINNAIILSNLPKGTKVEVYNLQGKRILSTHSENSKILKIQVQTKGIYIIKIGTQTIRTVVR